MQTNRKKTHKGRLSYTINPLQTIWKGQYAAVALESARVSTSQIKAAELALKRTIKKSGEFWIRINPNVSVSAKPAEVRMGKGKGSFSHFISRVQTGSILFEVRTNSTQGSEILARQAFNVAASKLPLKLRFCPLF